MSSAQALGEPAGNQVMLGFWPQTEAYYDTTPSILNGLFTLPSTSAVAPALNVSFPVFQIAQNFPLLPYNYVTGAGGPAPETLIEKTATDARVFLTVYPSDINNVTVPDLTVLGNQIADCEFRPPHFPARSLLLGSGINTGSPLPTDQNKLNRTVFLRWAPEMQGIWNTYGQQPVAFRNAWQLMYTTVKQIAPQTIVVWAPNTAAG
jgi:hypothetical protein